jgi:hypothetical protein
MRSLNRLEGTFGGILTAEEGRLNTWNSQFTTRSIYGAGSGMPKKEDAAPGFSGVSVGR